jgi:hypothetical protein
LKAVRYGAEYADKELPVDEEVGYLLVAQFMQMMRDFHGAYLKDE